MTVLADMAKEAEPAAEAAAAGVEGRMSEFRTQLVETHFRGRPGSPPQAPRDQLYVESLTAEEAQTLADVLAGGEMPEGANDTLVVCAEHCAEYGIDKVESYPPTPKKKSKR